jgi:hypothetical protein
MVALDNFLSNATCTLPPVLVVTPPGGSVTSWAPLRLVRNLNLGVDSWPEAVEKIEKSAAMST